LKRERPAVRGYGFRYAALATAATVTVAVAASWIYLKAPEAIIASSPPIPAQEEKAERPEPIAEVVALAPEENITLPAESPPVTKPPEQVILESTSPVAEEPPSGPLLAGVQSEAERVYYDQIQKAQPTEPPEPEEIADRMVVTTQRAAAMRFSDEVIQDLPVPGRFYQNALRLAPDAEDTDAASPRDFKAVVAGVSNVDPNSVRHYKATLGYGSAEHGQPEDDPGFNTESYDFIKENDFLAVLSSPLSTFSIDVDTASYSNIRRFLTHGQLPPPDAVRIEEMINYFHYDYAPPSGDAPFSASVEIATCPWRPEHRLARIGLKGEEISRDQLGGSNLVFLIDVSGSMQPPNKLPLLKSAFSLLVEQLDADDRVAIVVYANAEGLVLPSTPGSAKGEILKAIDRLSAGGSTNGGSGLKLAYRIARENYIPGGVNRVILATDGDFNVGVTNEGQLLRLIGKDARNGIFLTALGFGMGNYKDDRLETLADKGNGNYAYIDTIKEARKVLVEELGGTLVTIAKDVKIQVEFNPALVGSYRLIGYENRMLNKEDFNDDRKDAGEIGAGHSVTALYELAPPGSAEFERAVDSLKYQAPPSFSRAAGGGEVLTLKIRYKEPEGSKSRLLEFPIVDDGLRLAQASADFKFAAAVAEFGLILRESEHKGSASFDDVRALAIDGIGADEYGYRGEFLGLVGLAGGLSD
jgi:Ca-activated chloride channel family protein